MVLDGHLHQVDPGERIIEVQFIQFIIFFCFFDKCLYGVLDMCEVRGKIVVIRVQKQVVLHPVYLQAFLFEMCQDQ